MPTFPSMDSYGQKQSCETGRFLSKTPWETLKAATSSISSLGRRSRWREAVESVGQLQPNNVQPDAVPWRLKDHEGSIFLSKTCCFLNALGSFDGFDARGNLWREREREMRERQSVCVCPYKYNVILVPVPRCCPFSPARGRLQCRHHRAGPRGCIMAEGLAAGTAALRQRAAQSLQLQRCKQRGQQRLLAAGVTAAAGGKLLCFGARRRGMGN